MQEKEGRADKAKALNEGVVFSWEPAQRDGLLIGEKILFS
jgi:hypothetical protein